MAKRKNRNLKKLAESLAKSIMNGWEGNSEAISFKFSHLTDQQVTTIKRYVKDILARRGVVWAYDYTHGKFMMANVWSNPEEAFRLALQTAEHSVACIGDNSHNLQAMRKAEVISDDEYQAAISVIEAAAKGIINRVIEMFENNK